MVSFETIVVPPPPPGEESDDEKPVWLLTGSFLGVDFTFTHNHKIVKLLVGEDRTTTGRHALLC